MKQSSECGQFGQGWTLRLGDYERSNSLCGGERFKVLDQKVDRTRARADPHVDALRDKQLALWWSDETAHQFLGAASQDHLARRAARTLGVGPELSKLSIGVKNQHAVTFCKEGTERRRLSMTRHEHGDATATIWKMLGCLCHMMPRR